MRKYPHSLGQFQAPQQIVVVKKDKTKKALLFVGGVAILGIGAYFLMKRLGIGFFGGPRFSVDSVTVRPNASVSVDVVDGLTSMAAGTTQHDNTVNIEVNAARNKITFSIPNARFTGSKDYELTYTLTDKYGRNPVQKSIKVKAQA